MKKLITTLCLGALASAAFAQGTVNFANGGTTIISTNSVGLGGTAGQADSTAGAYNYALFIAPSTVTTIDSSLQGLLGGPWTFTGNTATNGTVAALRGRLNGGTPAVPGWGIGQTNSFLVLGWSTSLGSSWGAISNQLSGASLNSGVWSGPNLSPTGGFLGASGVGFLQAGGSQGTVLFLTPPLFGSADTAQGHPVLGFNLFTTNVPEPTSFALAGLGIAAMAILRRRKQ
jgi:hypothetical protein